VNKEHDEGVDTEEDRIIITTTAYLLSDKINDEFKEEENSSNGNTIHPYNTIINKMGLYDKININTNLQFQQMREHRKAVPSKR
jgi:uncharacterized membrane protein (UPF0182 family)